MREEETTIYTIERIMALDLPIGQTNDCGVFVKPFVVKVMVSAYAHIIIRLARSERGFHYGIGIETLTGASSFMPSLKWNCHARKFDAIEAAIREIERNQMGCRYRSAIEDAKRELNKYKYEQLTLF